MKSIIIIILFTISARAQTIVRYDLYVSDTLVSFAGKPKRAIAVNGQIPMPILEFTEGDSAVIYIHNGLNEETSFHWHGLILPNEQDGVPYLTTAPIKGGTTHLFNFKLVQSGSYWYHSHTKLQEQIGMYGSLIIHKKKNDPTIRDVDKIPDYAIVLSDWINEKPYQVHRKLHNATDWYAIKKGTTQSYGEAIRAGHFKTKITNEWKRMLSMDVSDVGYDKFLINGKDEYLVSKIKGNHLKAGDKIRLRIANGGSSSYFWMNYAGGKMTVVGNDGADVEPVEVDRLIIAVAETYDVVITIPEDNTAYEFLVTPEDRTKSTSVYFGNGIKQLKSPLPKLKYFEGMKMMNEMMKMNGELDDMGMQMSLNQMDMNVVMYPEISGESMKKSDDKMKSNENEYANHNPYDANVNSDITTLNYTMLKSPTKTNLPKQAPVKVLYFELSGNMNRYVWSLDNKTVSETDKILIQKGENVRIILFNGSMMRHPMHLHGHFFRVINGHGDFAPLKNVLDIMPMETDTIEFNASENGGDWFFHCHILYHMMSGMGRIFQYENSPANPQLPDKRWADRQLFKDDREFHLMAENDFATNGNDGEAMFHNTRWNLQAEWKLGYSDHHGYEIETHFGRYVDKMQWLFPYIGFDWRYRKLGIDEMKRVVGEKNLFGQVNKKNRRNAVCFGVQYMLPMLVMADGRIDTDGKFRIQLMREDISIDKRLRMNLMINSDKEYMVGVRYIITKNIGFSTHYDSDMGIGLGVLLTY